MTTLYANGDSAFTAFVVSECMEFGVSLYQWFTTVQLYSNLGHLDLNFILCESSELFSFIHHMTSSHSFDNCAGFVNLGCNHKCQSNG